MLLGAIADDMTGATDLALMLSKSGMKTVQVIGPDAVSAAPPEAEAVVVAMKSRTNPPDEAIAMSLQALAALQDRGVEQVLFKYCSTFDSTDQGNIGPVADALLDALGAPVAVACSAFPDAARTIYQGHLFVGDRLLSESGMRDHPLTPMTDPDLVRVLGRQSRNRVGLVDLATVRAGAAAIRKRLDELADAGIRLAIVDTVANADLLAIGAACHDAALITGGSGIAMGLPENFRRAGRIGAPTAVAPPDVTGPGAILSGSCSQATNEQVARYRASGFPVFHLDPSALADDPAHLASCLDWFAGLDGSVPCLIHATDAPEQVARVQQHLGRDRAGAVVEQAMAHLATALVEQGVRRLVVAGGETSGAVVAALGVEALRIGPEIAPGVPWTETSGAGPRLALALKSGNFGGPDFFADAFAALP